MSNKYIKHIIERNIRFIDKSDNPDISHSYWDEHGERYTSATQLIGKVTPEFNTVPEAIKYAQKHGGTAEFWINEWERIKNEACDRGNYHHDRLEDGVDKINNEYWDKDAKQRGIYDTTFKRYNRVINHKELENSIIKEDYPVIYARLVELLNQGWVLYAEKIVYWADFYIAGKIDLLAIKESSEGRWFKIIDWKTNKADLKFTSGYYKKENGVKTSIWIEKDERLKAPLNNLQNCKGNIYILQLSLYARMMEELGYIFTGLELYHIRDIGTTVYNLPYWRQAVEQLALSHGGKFGKIANGVKVVANKPKFGVR
jgi:PD-(D/E)XK nuclease superfamily